MKRNSNQKLTRNSNWLFPAFYSSHTTHPWLTGGRMRMWYLLKIGEPSTYASIRFRLVNMWGCLEGVSSDQQPAISNRIIFPRVRNPHASQSNHVKCLTLYHRNIPQSVNFPRSISMGPIRIINYWVLVNCNVSIVMRQNRLRNI